MANLMEVDWHSLPEPQDDGAANHLGGARIPDVALTATDGTSIALAALGGRTVAYCYPMTGKPGVALPDGWDMIPGARGCTPQSCAFRDHAADLRRLGVDHLFGISTQDTADQGEAAERLHLPFPLLSDADLALTSALRLPTMDVAGATLLKRLTMVIDEGTITRVFYPVFPPDRSAADVIAWLASAPYRRASGGV
ncbi:peroxiredoxin [Qipengyuania qiaonensis]|uniref:Peroxiredoxin n=1 Tax=Qipengyuania qiaonensis TaxID=2867240 RepID=A0ABS7J2T1_9SPHN|nr:peroxiredoxin [Qipengyuania qiaonensis]MBX7481629.1 peroxiredoxin [Qipengyuania qiaonensis]